MVLVDTSVWIRFLANHAPWAAELDRLLGNDDAAGHDLVFGELLIGDRGKRQQFMDSYELIHRVATVPHSEVVEFVRTSGLHGRGIGWVDVHLLASALVASVPLWTADEKLGAVARELRIGYQ